MLQRINGKRTHLKGICYKESDCTQERIVKVTDWKESPYIFMSNTSGPSLVFYHDKRYRLCYEENRFVKK